VYLRLNQINGGGVAGAIAGNAIGNYVGFVVGNACSSISRRCGDSAQVSSDVGLVAYGATVAVFTVFGALLPTP